MLEAIARRRRVLAVVLAAVVALAVAGWGLTYSPLFAARHIKISGNHVVGDRAVVAAAGVSASTNVAHLDREAIVAKLEAQPWIAGASVDVDLPNTLLITVHERTPLGVVAALGARSILANDGTTLPLGGVQIAGLPTVRAALGVPTADQLGAAAALLRALDPVVTARVDEVVVGEDGTVTLTLASGARVDAGERGEEPQKALALRAVLLLAAQKHLDVTSIDVSSPSAPALTLRDGSTLSYPS